MSPQNGTFESLEPPETAAVNNMGGPSSYYVPPANPGQTGSAKPYSLFRLINAGPIPFMVGLALATVIVLGGVLAISHYLNKPSTSTNEQQKSASVNNSAVFGDGKSNININLDTTISSGKNLTATGRATFVNQLDSASAFRIQNAAGTNLLNASTADGTITINGNLVVTGTINGNTIAQLIAAAGANTSAKTGPQGPRGASGIKGANGRDGNSCGLGVCVSLQGSATGIQENGNIDITGTVTADGIEPASPGDIGNSPGLVKTTIVNTVNSTAYNWQYNESPRWTAVGPDGFLRMTYVDNVYKDLHFLRCLDTDCTTSNNTLIISTPGYPDFVSLAIGSDGFARILYSADDYDSFYFVRCSDADCATRTTNLIASDGGNSDYYEASMALGSNDLAGVTYADYLDDTLHYIQCTNLDCSSKTNTQIVTTGLPEYSSTIIGSDGFARIAYEDYDSANPGPGKLQFIRCTSGDCSTKVTNVVALSDLTGLYYITLLIGSNGLPQISFNEWGDSINGRSREDVRYAACNDADCSSASLTTIDGSGNARQASMVLGSDGFPRISYGYTTLFSQGQLGVSYVACKNISCTDTSSVRVAGSGFGDPAQIVMGKDGLPRVIYNDFVNSNYTMARFLNDLAADTNSGSSLGSSSKSFSDLYLSHGLYINGSTLKSASDNTLSISSPADLNIQSGSNLNLQSTGQMVLATSTLVINPALESSQTPQGLLSKWYTSDSSFDYQNVGSGALAATIIDGPVNWTDTKFSPPAGSYGSYLNAKWVGYVRADYTETYTFYTTSDDGSRLYVNNKLVVDNWGSHGPIEKSGTIALALGEWYPIEIDYFQGGGGGSISASWSSPSTPKALIPLDHLKHDPSTDLRVNTNKGFTLLDVDSASASINDFGTLLIKPTISSTNAFLVQNTDGSAFLTVDTANSIVSVAGSSTIFGSLTVSNAHFKSTQTTAPTIGTPSNCGTAPSAAVTAGSTDSAGSFTITAGTGSPTTCDTVITFNKTYGAAPKSVVLTPTTAVGSATGALSAQVSAETATTFTIKFAPTNPSASQKNSFYYWVIE